MTFENRENLVEGMISREVRSRIGLEKATFKRHNPKILEMHMFGSETMMASAKRINWEAAKTLGLF